MFNTNCPAESPSDQFEDEDDPLTVGDDVERISHVGPMMRQQLHANGIYTVGDLIGRFSNTPPYPAKKIERDLGALLTSPNRNQCVVRKNGSYQVSDVNQCAFNNVLALLRFAHLFRGEYGIPEGTNIRNARRVPMRRRGTAYGIRAKSVRFCGCQRTEQACVGNEELRCRWHPRRSSGLSRGVCTPNVSRAPASGFRGRGSPWPENSRDPQSSQFTRAQGTRDGSRHTVADNGDIYVDRWRIPGRVRSLRRSARLRGQSRLSGGGSMKEWREHILASEGRLGSRLIDERRRFNELAGGGGGRKITDKDVFHALEEYHNKNKGKKVWKNVRTNAITKNGQISKDGSVHPTSFSGQLGFVRDFRDPFACISIMTRSESGRKLATVLGKFIRQRYPKFKFTSICVNRNWTGALHVDRNNVGPSMMYTTGGKSTTGGELYIYNPREGGGRKLKTLRSWIAFDGNDPHMTYPYKGVRYSLVFYQTQRKIHPKRRTELRKLFFNVPKTVRLGIAKEPRKLRIERAIRDLKENRPDMYRLYMKRQGKNMEKLRVMHRKLMNRNNLQSLGKKFSTNQLAKFRKRNSKKLYFTRK